MSCDDSQSSKPNGSTFDLSNKGLDSFPRLSPSPNVTELLANFNSLVSLPDDLPIAFPFLRIVDVSGNELTTLPESLVRLESTLETLNVDDNELTRLPDGASDLRRLRVLRARGNRLAALPEGLGARTPDLVELHVDENRLTLLPDSLSSATALHVLEAGDNRLARLPDDLGALKALRVLNVSNNCLVALPDSFRFLSNLEMLDVGSNRIESLPDAFASCCRLRCGFFGVNCLGHVPAWIGCMPRIEELDLSDNRLLGDALPSRFGENLNRLKYFNLAGNQLTVLPDTFALLESLEDLRLGSTIPELERRDFQNGNWLRVFPDGFGHLSKLKHLQADENRIVELPKSFGASLQLLTYVDLAQNTLAALPDSFCDLAGLVSCRLSQNKLSMLPSDFGRLSELRDLYLDNNSLTDLPESFAQLVGLKSLDLFGNRLLRIPLFLAKMTKLTKLDLDGNSFGCNIKDVPSLVCTRRYASLPATHGWRGRSLPEQKPMAIDVTYDSERATSEEEAAELKTQTEILTRALAMSQSLWKSHQIEPGQESRIFETCLSRATQFDDSLLAEEDVQGSQDCGRDEESDSGVGVVFESGEDWDKEVEHRSPFTVSVATLDQNYLSRPVRRLTREQRAELAIRLHKDQKESIKAAFTEDNEFFFNASLQPSISIKTEASEMPQAPDNDSLDGQFDDCD